jgi:hypothetical protein
MIMQNWDERSLFTANVLNPAFCGEIIRRVASEYSRCKKVDELSFALVFIILPILLHKTTRESLPTTTRTKFHDWLSNNESIRASIVNRIKYMVPFTRESIIFLCQYEKIRLSSLGGVIVVSKRNKNLSGELTNDVDSILKKSKFLGKWMSSFPEEKIVYSLLGIIP